MVDNEPRRLAGRYEVRAMIGRGGMAQVHLGFDTRLSRVVAIKMLRTDLARDSLFQTRFRREAQSAASLNHPNIVAVYDTGEEELHTPDGSSVQVPYIVMEYVEGHTVRDLLAGGAPVPIDEAIEIISGVLAALEYSHSHGLVHRDIKPGNVMLTNQGKIKVMDFGIARAVTDSQATMTQTNAVVGTAQYLSPEQARGEVVDARSDLYSTGCVLFELLTGRPPFKGDSAVSVAYQHVSELPPTPSSLTSDVPESIDRVVMKSLAKDKEQRYRTAHDMLSDLERAARGALVLAPATSTWEEPVSTQTTTMGTTAMPPTPPPPPQFRTQTRRQAAAVQEVEEERRKSPVGVIFTVLLLLAALAVGGWAAYQYLGNQEPEKEMVTIPASVIGADQAQARQILTEAGLKIQLGEKTPSDEVEAGHVVSTNPDAGTEVEKGSTVTLNISSGPEGVTVPDLKGLSQSQARAALEKEGLKLGEVETQDGPQEKDRVISSSPEAGEAVKKGDTVKIVVSSGRVVIPENLVGQDENTVLDALRDLGLSTRVEKMKTNDFAPGTVVSLSPNGTVDVGKSITVTVAEAAPAPPAPTQPSDRNPSAPPTDGDNNGGGRGD